MRKYVIESCGDVQTLVESTDSDALPLDLDSFTAPVPSDGYVYVQTGYMASSGKIACVWELQQDDSDTTEDGEDRLELPGGSVITVSTNELGQKTLSVE